ncbi:MAG: hypothetical protein ABIE36_03735 [Candidatus Diapherotrites archaeon]
MKKVFILFIFTLILISTVSAEILILQQPNKIYNIDDTITIPVTIKTISEISGTFSMDLLCSGKQVNFYRNGIHLKSGEEKTMEAFLVLTKDEIGETTGTCKIKGSLGLGRESVLLNEFRISNLMIVQPNTEQKEFEPAQSILIRGSVIKENGQDANGFINMELTTENSSEDIIQLGTINNGFYAINITLPENMRAGNYLIKLSAYEMDSKGKQTNKGFSNYNIAIKQIPKSLEIVFETKDVEPGTNLKVKAILHDQTGDKIASTSIISIKKGTGTSAIVQQQSEKSTDEYLEYPFEYNEPPSNWTVFAVSNQLTAESIFTIIEKEDFEVEIMNDTVKITNKGNVPYNNSVIIRIGENQTRELNVSLGVDKSQEYTLKAPDGTYEVEVTDSEGRSKGIGMVTLEGRTVEVKEAKSGFSAMMGVAIWIFVILILGFTIFLFFRKGYKRIFFGKMRIKKKVKEPRVNTAWENRAIPLSKNSNLETKNKANLSLSIKGHKQEVSITALNIKNLAEIQSKKGGSEEALQRIINFAEDRKAFVYENQENLFFILTPLKTRALKNEMAALEIAQKAKEILSEHNKLFKQKISFGISLNIGMIIEKLDRGILEFVSIENLLTNAKRIASISKEDILIGEDMKGRLPSVRTERDSNEKMVAYKIKEIKYHDEDHSRFIKSFLKRAEADKK